jgi:hypothetical protein
MCNEFALQVFNDIRWSRDVPGLSYYRWLSNRQYQLDVIAFEFLELEDIIGIEDDMSLNNNSLSINQPSDRQPVDSRRSRESSRHLVTLCNPHVKKLRLDGTLRDHEFTFNVFRYLSKRCPEVKEIVLVSTSAEAVRQAMDCFPNLTAVQHDCSFEYLVPLTVYEAISYPNMENFIVHSDQNDVALIPMIKACPNLRSLDLQGSLMIHGLHEIMSSCSKLTSLILNGSTHYVLVEDVTPLISAIGEYGLQLRYLTMAFYSINIQSGSSVRNNMIRILKRLKYLVLDVVEFVTDNDNDSESSISSLFSSPGVDLRSLKMGTHNQNADMIALLLQGCRNIEKLHLYGGEGISPVLMKISSSCHQLVDLELHYGGLADGPAMKALLQSCPQLRSLDLSATLDVRAYESLALCGGNITKLKLSGNGASSVESGSLSFTSDFPFYETSFKQQRKHSMTLFDFALRDLDVKSLVKFLSCFGLIEELSVRVTPSQLPPDLETGITDDLPVFHGHRVSVRSSISNVRRVDSVFLVLMNSCRSMRELYVEFIFAYPGSCIVEESSLIKVACDCSQRNNPLRSLFYPRSVRLGLSNLQELFPELKIFRR